jgi:hypothetical protein
MKLSQPQMRLLIELLPSELIEAHQKRIDDAQLIPDDIPLMEIADKEPQEF